MNFSPSKRLAGMTTGIFAELVEAKHRATRNGQKVIDLSVGSPDLPPSELVVQTLIDGIQNPTQYGYAMTATVAFREAVANFYGNRYGVHVDPSTQVLQLTGSQEGLSHLSMSLVDEGDIVLVPDPGYPIYEANVTLAGATVYPMPLRAENGYLPDLSAIPMEICAKARLMILNYPGNPVTALAPVAFFEEVVAFAKRHSILVVHDFAYSELVFDGQQAVSFLSVPGAIDVGIEFNSLSKTFNMAGCRIGYVLGNESVIRSLAKLKSHIDYGLFLPIQQAATVALNADYSHLATLAKVYQGRRDALMKGLAKSGWHVNQSPATMFLWTHIPDGWTSRGFAFSLLSGAGVAVTPGHAFGLEGEGYVRIALVQPERLLIEAAERIDAFLQTTRPS